MLILVLYTTATTPLNLALSKICNGKNEVDSFEIGFNCHEDSKERRETLKLFEGLSGQPIRKTIH